MLQVAKSEWGVTWQELLPDECLLKEAEHLIREKFSQDAYNRKR